MKDLWLFNEYIQSGTDFTDTAKVEAYDRKMSKFRNYAEEAKRVLKLLGTGSGDMLLDIGTGTGGFAIEAAKSCRTVYAIDVSTTMLEYARSKAASEEVTNIEWINAGFLTFSFGDIKFDSVFSNAALHHLPDFWKAIAIKNVYNALKPGGRFLLGDVIFSGEIESAEQKVDSWIEGFREIDIDLYNESAAHVREEFSTFSWLLEEMLSRAGFRYSIVDEKNNFMLYLCTKP